MPANSPRGDGHVEDVPQFHAQGRPRATGRDFYDKFHMLRHLGEALDKVHKSEYARVSSHNRRFIKGQKYTLLPQAGHPR